MRFEAPWFALFLASIPGCMPSATIQTAPVVDSEPAPTERAARHARLSGEVTLYAEPSSTSLQAKWTAAERVVELLEARDGFWQIRTLLPREVMALGFEADAGLDVLVLVAWVSERDILTLEPGTTAGSPGAEPSDGVPSSSGNADAPPSAAARRSYGVRSGSVLRWPDGRPAGEVAVDHVFFTPASMREVEGPDGILQFGCHEHRTLPTGGSIAGWLCSTVDPGPGLDLGTVVALDRPRSAPVTAGDHDVTGELDRDIIRRIVRAHINEVRSCYNAGLALDPQLAGRVAINFVIGPDGYVTSAVVQENTLSDLEVARCIAKAVETWRFPKPSGGGNVVVTYPFNLTPG